MNNQNGNRAAVITALILLLIDLSGITGIYVMNNPSGNTVYMSIPTVSASLNDSAGGNHSLQINFSIAVAKKSARKVDQNALEASLSSAVSNLSYDRLTGYNSVDYVKEEAKKQLKREYPADVVEDIYISDIAVDFVIDATNSNQPNSDAMRGLFQNIK